MKIIEKALRILFDSNYRFKRNAARGRYLSMPDEEYLRRMFIAKLGYEPNLQDPRTFNEKLQWLKLHDRKPVYSIMVDKFEAKRFVAERIGEEYLIPTLGVWDRFEDIDFSKLPNKFVLKCTHDSGGLILCKDKTKLDIEYARQKINKSMSRNYYYKYREWPYKDVIPRIIAEEYMDDGQNERLRDYKVYTINGVAKFCMINQDRGKHTKADYFDREYNWLDFTWGYDHASVLPQKPLCFEKMFELAEILATDTIELRVDFYEIDGKVYFGEMTFFDGGGFDSILPIDWDYKLGEILDLHQKK